MRGNEGEKIKEKERRGGGEKSEGIFASAEFVVGL